MHNNPFYQNTKLEKHKPKPAPQQSTDETAAANARAGQAGAYKTANATDANFSGPTTSSPYYKSLLATGTDATTTAYNNAKATSAAKANAAGFGNAGQPVAEGANNEINAQESASLARLPAQAEEATAPLQLEAAGQQIGEGTALGGEAVGYSGQASNLAQAYMNARNSFYNNLINAGAGAATGMYAA